MLLFLLSFRSSLENVNICFANNFFQSVSCLIIILMVFFNDHQFKILMKTSHFYFVMIVFHILSEKPCLAEVTKILLCSALRASWFSFYILVYESSQINSGGWCKIRIKVYFSRTNVLLFDLFFYRIWKEGHIFHVYLPSSDIHRPGF